MPAPITVMPVIAEPVTVFGVYTPAAVTPHNTCADQLIGAKGPLRLPVPKSGKTHPGHMKGLPIPLVERLQCATESGDPSMRRREFIRVVGGAAVSWPFSARAQQAIPKVGVLMAGFEGSAENAPRLAAFRKALADLG